MAILTLFVALAPYPRAIALLAIDFACDPIAIAAYPPSEQPAYEFSPRAIAQYESVLAANPIAMAEFDILAVWAFRPIAILSPALPLADALLPMAISLSFATCAAVPPVQLSPLIATYLQEELPPPLRRQ